jgi:hypothetical protein
MPSFKTKSKKKIQVCKKNSTTLDSKHNEFINEFNNNENIEIPQLLNEKKQLKEKLTNIENKLNIEEKMEINDRINEIKEKIKKLKDKKKNYYLDNSNFIFEYFENKKNISNCENNTISVSKNKLLDNFFKIKNNDVTETSDNEDTKFTNEKNNNIVYKYLTNIDYSFLDIDSFIRQADICQYCNKGELIPVDDEGLLLCNICFKNVPYLIENEKQCYKEPPKEVCFYAYKRINHFKEILSQFQGKETTQIHDDVIEKIKQQIKKERIELKQLNYKKTKEILKKLEFNKYYEHIAFIKNKLGINPIIMSCDLEEKLCNLFIDLQPAYAKHVPDYRDNFLNYYYVLFKLCELLGETQYLEHIPMLKDRNKLIEQDMIWSKMCRTLDWEYIGSV